MSWTTWSPFQSEKVKQICHNLTASEKSELIARSYKYGAWCGISFAFPVSQISMYFFVQGSRPILPIELFIILIVIHIINIPIWQRKIRVFLSTTEWAKTQGYTPGQLKLFSLRN